MSKRSDELKKMRDELQAKFSEACKKLDATIKAEEDEDDPAKKQAAIDYSGLRLAREVAEKSGQGRRGTQAGVFVARMFPKRGGPPTE